MHSHSGDWWHRGQYMLGLYSDNLKLAKSGARQVGVK